jgi:hypothetical protein
MPSMTDSSRDDKHRLDWIALVIRDICEIPYRFSPDDFPEAMVVTPEELRMFIVRRAPVSAVQDSEAFERAQYVMEARAAGAEPNPNYPRSHERGRPSHCGREDVARQMEIIAAEGPNIPALAWATVQSACRDAARWLRDDESRCARSASVPTDAKDAARYRWLRDKSVPPHNFYIAVPDEFKDERYTPQQVDAAIDAAIGGSSESTAEAPMFHCAYCGIVAAHHYDCPRRSEHLKQGGERA